MSSSQSDAADRPGTGPLQLRVFLSSPGDVVDERRMAIRVMERLEGELSSVVRIHPVVWEHEPVRATQTFQDQIEPPAHSDVLVCILWSRLGTRLPGQYTREDGTIYDSGTAFELETARAAFEKAGRPDILVYRKTAAPLFDVSDRDDRERRMSQWDQLADYLKSWFFNEDGSFRAGFTQFERLDEFEELLEQHLRRLITELLAERGEQTLLDEAVQATWLSGSPFRGLAAFDVEHADIFHGRTGAIASAKEHLQRNALAGSAFVLVTGMSGSGKSSMVRAGLVPALTVPGAVEGVGLWRWGTFRPAESTTPLRALLEALFAESALPELADGDFDSPAALESLAGGDPEQLLSPLRGALKRAARAEQERDNLTAPPTARLLLVVDQFEELFTRDEGAVDQRNAFAEVLSVLAASGEVWLVTTLRSDFYHRCAELPALAALKDGHGTFDLLAPSGPEIAQMIRKPARAAGLAFESSATRGDLADVIQSAAVANAGSLPLLSFVLDELYKSCQPERRLTFAAYDQLGGLEGAVAQRAEQVVAALPESVRAGLGELMRALVSVADGQASPTARRVAKARVTGSANATALVDALIDARLLTSDEAGDGAVVRVAHEALLTRWPRAMRLIEENREFLQVRARVQPEAQRWADQGRSADLLLPAGLRLTEAKDLLMPRTDELEPGLLDYVTASIDADDRRTAAESAARNRRLRISQAIAAGGTVLALLAGGSAWQAFEQRELAEQQARVAEAARGEAETQRANAEAQTKAADLARADAEEQRGIAEAQATAAERSRREAEQQAAAAEAARAEAETASREAEAAREEAESQARAAELARADAESERRNAEAQARAAEQARAEAETQRRNAEEQAEVAEQARTEAEVERRNAEEQARAAELARADADAERRNAEEQATRAEAARAEAELNLTKARIAEQAASEKAVLARKEAARAEELALSALAQTARLQARTDPASALMTSVRAVSQSLLTLGRVTDEVSRAAAESVDAVFEADGTYPLAAPPGPVAVDATGSLFAVVDSDGARLRIIDADARVLHEGAESAAITALAFSADSQVLTLGFADGGTRRVDLRGRPLGGDKVDGPVLRVHVDPAGRFSAVVTEREIAVVNTSGSRNRRIAVNGVRASALDTAGAAIVWVESDGTVRRAEAAGDAAPVTLGSRSSRAVAISVSHDGRLLALGRHDGWGQLRAAATGAHINWLGRNADRDGIIETRFEKGDGQLVVRYANEQVRRYDLDQRLWTDHGISPAPGPLALPAFTPLAVASVNVTADGRPQLWSPGWRGALWRGCTELSVRRALDSPIDETARRAEEACRALVWSSGELPWLQGPWALATGQSREEYFWLREQVAERTDVTGRPLLNVAVSANDETAFSALNAANAGNTLPRDARGNSALMVAAAEGNEAMLATLVERYPAEVDARNDAGYTALLMAARAGHESAATRLLEAGADATAVGADGTTARTWFERSGNAAFAARLDAPQRRGLAPVVKADDQWDPAYLVPEGTAEIVREGLRHELGDGVAQCFECAVQRYRQGAEQGDGFAMYLLSRAYRQGNGVPRDGPLTYEWAARSAATGSAFGMNALGNAYENGRGTDKDQVRAKQLWEQAAALGNRRAMYNLGVRYRDGAPEDPVDLPRALTWFERSAALDQRAAMLELARMLHHGWGAPVDNVRAMALLERALELGTTEAARHLGHLYEQGVPEANLAPDVDRAARYYQQAASAGDRRAMQRLAWLIETGAVADGDADLAFEWYLRAARAGDPRAAARVADRLQEGRPWQASEAEIRFWLRVSGTPLSRRTASLLSARMDRGEALVLERLQAVLPVAGAPTKRVRYDDNGRLMSEETPERVRRFEYHPLLEKIAAVTEIQRSAGQTLVRTEFEYDGLGNLVFVRRNDGRSVKLRYNAEQRIDAMTTQDDETMSFVYDDELGKPVVITLEGVGSINVTYDDKGEIDKVDSDAGHRMALRVTQLFQGLLALVKHAEVDL